MQSDSKPDRDVREPPKVQHQAESRKCVFEDPKGKLLGYIISEHGIKANPKKIAAISNMGPIRNVKGM